MRVVFAALALALLLTPRADAKLRPVGTLEARVDASGVRLTWQDRSRGETRYVVRRAERKVRLKRNRRMFTDRRVKPATRYRYSVRACRRKRCAKVRRVTVQTPARSVAPVPGGGGTGPGGGGTGPGGGGTGPGGAFAGSPVFPRVRWKDPGSNRRLVEEFGTVDEALDFRAHLRLASRRGALEDLGRGRVVLRDFVANEWWPKDAGRRLERSTLKTYAPVWNLHIDPRLGHLQLRQLSAPVVQTFKEQMESDGVGAPTARLAMAILQAICRYAIAKGELTSNPVREVRKPAVSRKLDIVAISPAQVEMFGTCSPRTPRAERWSRSSPMKGFGPKKHSRSWSTIVVKERC